jgi:hypothetical protein
MTTPEWRQGSRVDHRWLRNVIRCGFTRHFMTGHPLWGTRPQWEGLHVLRAYEIDRYGIRCLDVIPGPEIV